MKKLYLIIVCFLLLLTGCMTQPTGEVSPIPEGCLYMEFFSSSDDSACKRESGRISAVITPTKRVEPLQKQWEIAEFEKAIFKTKRQDDPLSYYLPGLEAWEYVKKYLKAEDEIWTFGILDIGFIILRGDKIFCLVVTSHQL